MDLKNYLTPSEHAALRLVDKRLPVSRASVSRLLLTGYIAQPRKSAFGLYRAEITIMGKRYLCYMREQKHNLVWTRSLSIISIIISGLSLLLAGVSLYLQFR